MFDRKFQFNVRFDLILATVLMWCHVINHVHADFKTYLFYLVVLIFIFIYRALYREIPLRIELTGADLCTFGGFFLVQYFFQAPYLHYSLGGDELFHADRAAFILEAMQGWVAKWQVTPIEEYRRHIWNLFDLRHIPVGDLWRIISAFLIASIAALVFIWNKAKTWKFRLPLFVAFFILASFVAYRSSVDTGVHPGFRLFPIFVGQVFFGFTEFGCRIPGVFFVSAVCLVFFKFLSRDLSFAWRFSLATAIAFIPVVFYVANAVEPSVYGFWVWTTGLLLAWKFLEEKRPDYLIALGVLTAVGSTMRQTTIGLWALVGVLYLLSPRRWELKYTLRVFLPGLIVLPYFYFISHSGTFLLSANEGTFFEKMIRSVVSGRSIMTALNSVTLPWVFFWIVGAAYLWRKILPREASLFLVFIPAYAIFFNIISFLWGMGRYQAEYVAPFMVLHLFLLARYAGPKIRPFVTVALLFLFSLTLETHANLSLDINYADWPTMKITTTASHPYRDALTYLKRSEAGGSFVILGGHSLNGPTPLWFTGHSFSETLNFQRKQDALGPFLESGPSLGQIQDFAADKGVQYFVVQGGSRRELQHRPPKVQQAIHIFEQAMVNQTPGIQKVASFGGATTLGENGGVLDIYKLFGRPPAPPSLPPRKGK